jgi:hypothetical protein
MLKIPQIVGFPDFSPFRMNVCFTPYRNDKIRTVRKKSERLVTLIDFLNVL